MRKHSFLRSAAALMIAAMILLSVPAGAAWLRYTPSDSYASGPYCASFLRTQFTEHPRDNLVRVAISQIGYHEGVNENDLSGLSSGHYDYSEYGYWYGTEVMGNDHGHYGQWSGMFVSWCAYMAYISESVIYPACYSIVGDHSHYFHVNFVTSGYTPRTGDLIFFDWPDAEGEWNHMGIVHYVSNGKVFTLEGNTDRNCAEARSYSLDDPRIHGYGIPEYRDNVITHDPADPANYPVPERTLECGCYGADVLWMEAALTKLGYSEDPDGVFSEQNRQELRFFQVDSGLIVTGVLDSQTLSALMSAYNALPTPSPTEEPRPSQVPTPIPTETPVDGPVFGNGPDRIMGDVDSDGVITAADSLFIMRHAMGIITLPDFLAELADVDVNGIVDVYDSLRVLRVALGIDVILTDD